MRWPIEPRKLWPNVFEEVWPREWLRPLTDMWETNSKYIVETEVPGVKKNDIELNLAENNVEIKVEKDQEIEKDQDVYTYERNYRGFYRNIPLPENAIGDKIQAKYRYGVLRLEIPKRKTKEKKKRIEVS